MRICTLEKHGVPVWGPTQLTKPLIATGSNGGVLQKADEPNYLRVSRFDSLNGTQLLGQAQSPAKFSSLDWSDTGLKGNNLGLIAGGMADGAITLWNVDKILAISEQSQIMGKGCISAMPIHAGAPVRSLEFNPNMKNLLASGGSEVLIQDIGGNLKKPAMKPGQPNLHNGSAITSISWNRVVSHILASASENGKIVVWDLRQSKSIFEFQEPLPNQGFNMDGTKMQPSARDTKMIWNPENSPQFAVANDDETNSSFNVWDLRNHQYPVQQFPNVHQGGITSISWCLADPNLVVSTGKDQRTVVTNFKTGEIVLEFPQSEQNDDCGKATTVYQKVLWSQHHWGKIAALDSEGNTDILSISPTSRQAIGSDASTSDDTHFAQLIPSEATGAPYTPKWLKRGKCGATFGFGNQLAIFGTQKSSKGQQQNQQQQSQQSSNSGQSEKVQQIKILPKISTPQQDQFATKVSSFLERFNNSGHFEALVDQLIREASSEDEKLELLAIKCLRSDNIADLLKQVGYDEKKITFQAERFLGKEIKKKTQMKITSEPQEVQAQQTTNVLDKPPVVTENPFAQEFTPLTAESAADFFNQLGTQQAVKPPIAEESKVRKDSGADFQSPKPSNEVSPHGHTPSAPSAFDPQTSITETVSRNGNWDEGLEGMIKRNLMFGNNQYAAEIALKAGRPAEALLIAFQDGKKLFDEITQLYYETQKDSFVSGVLRSITDENKSVGSLLEPLEKGDKNLTWIETLAYFYTYIDEADYEERKHCVKQLGKQLQEGGKIVPAIVCYTLANEAQEVLRLWTQRALYRVTNSQQTSLDALYELMVKFALLWKSQEGESIDDQDAPFASILAETARQMSLGSVDSQKVIMQFFEQMALTQLSDEDIGSSAMTLATIRDQILCANFEEIAPEIANPHQKPFNVVKIPIPRAMSSQNVQHSNQLALQARQQPSTRGNKLNQGGNSQKQQPNHQRGGQGQMPNVRQQPHHNTHTYTTGTPSHTNNMQQQMNQTSAASSNSSSTTPLPPRKQQAVVAQNNLMVANFGYDASNKQAVQQKAQPNVVGAGAQMGRPAKQMPANNQGGPKQPFVPVRPSHPAGPVRPVGIIRPPSLPQKSTQNALNQQMAAAVDMSRSIPSDPVNPVENMPKPVRPVAKQARPAQPPARPRAPVPIRPPSTLTKPSPSQASSSNSDSQNPNHQQPFPSSSASQAATMSSSAPVSRVGGPSSGKHMPPPPPPKRNTPAQISAPQVVMASVEACQQVSQMLAQIMGVYENMETNQRLKGQTTEKIALLENLLSEGQLSEKTCNDLYQIFAGLGEGNIQGVRGTIAQISQNSWQEVKDWISGLKALVAFQQSVMQQQQ